MKQKILGGLQRKFNGVSDPILSRIADKLAKTATTEEEVTTAIERVTIQQLIEGEADRRATEATLAAISNYEKKHSLKEGKPVTEGGQGKETELEKKDDDSDTPAWAKSLIESHNALSKKLAALEGNNIATSRKQKLQTIIGKLPEKLQKPYTRIAVKDMTDEEFQTLTTEISTEVEGLVIDANTKGAVFGRPGGKGKPITTGKEPSKEEVEEFTKQLKL
jgi:hypothetical protein